MPAASLNERKGSPLRVISARTATTDTVRRVAGFVKNQWQTAKTRVSVRFGGY